MRFMADIYGNQQNPALAHNPGYGLFLLVLIGVAGLVLWAMTKPKK